MKYVLTEDFIRAVKICRTPQYYLAQHAGLPNNIFSMILNGLYFSDYYKPKIEHLAKLINFDPSQIMGAVNDQL